jgi:hypothetical protein
MKPLIFLNKLVLPGLALLLAAPLPALAVKGTATFECQGAEYSQHLFKRDTKDRELRFQLTTLTVDGKTYSIRLLGRSLNAEFSGKAIGNKREKFVLFHDEIDRQHQLTYEISEGKLIKANCILVDYK